jgi:hypothetical protein
MTATCPFCEYEGASSEVEAHISGSSDQAHQGKVGSRYRGLVESSHGNEDEGEVEAGIPIPVSSTTAIVVTVAVVAALLVISASRQPDEAAEQRGGVHA